MRGVVFAVAGLALGVGAYALGLAFSSPQPRGAATGHVLRPGLPVFTAEATPGAPARPQETPRAVDGVTSGTDVRLLPNGTPEAGTNFRLTKSSGIRHNAKCRHSWRDLGNLSEGEDGRRFMPVAGQTEYVATCRYGPLRKDGHAMPPHLTQTRSGLMQDLLTRKLFD